MGWIYLPSVTVQNGSNIVTVAASATDSIKPGDGLLIGAYDLVEIIEVSIGQLKLKKNWPSASQSNAEAAVVPTFGDFNAATAALRQATTITQGNFAEMEKWWTETGQVTFKAYNNTEHTVRTAKQMDQDISVLEDQANVLIAEVAGAGYARSESDMITDRARNNQLFAASGHIHAGKHRNDLNALYGRPIQDGLWTYLSNSNVLRLGAYKALTYVEGDSKTDESVFNFSGVAAHLKGLNTAYENAQLTLPPAPKGTEVYDSDTGILTNFETAIDPKYGDVAADSNEAVARAFEGLVKNGDMRLGDIGVWGNPYPLRGTVDISDGLLVVTDTVSDPAGCHAIQTINLTAGVEYEVGFILDSVEGTSNTTLRNFVQSTAAGNASYFITDVDVADLIPGKLYTAKFTPTDTSGHRIILYAPSQAGTAKYSYVYLRKATESVVTSPVDLVGFEIFLRPITESDPFIYPYGMQQSKLTSVDGIPAVENNVRPITHFEVYPGDTSSRGRGWSLFDGSLTDAQKAKILQNPAHNIYRMNDGTLVQWTVSQRTIRGAGNGDWEAIFASGSGDLSLCFKNKPSSLVTARGALDSTLSASYSNSYRRPARASLNSNDLGIWKLIETNAASVAKNNECYFYVFATVPRLNQGAYHPEWNPTGTASGWKNNGSGRAPWHDSLITQFVSPASCFKSSNDSSGADGGYDPTTGKLGGRTDRPDGLLHDVIYVSGLNGVIDHRPKYGAWNASSAEQAAVVREAVKNGTYRGREKLKAMIPYDNGGGLAVTASNSSHTYFGGISFVSVGFKVGDPVILYQPSTGVSLYGSISTNAAYIVLTPNPEDYGKKIGEVTNVITGLNLNEPVTLLISTDSDITVEGEFTQTDVLGDPANILQTDSLKNGWLGGWIAKIPDDVTSWSEFSATRKKISSGSVSKIATDDNGVTWIASTHAWDDIANAPSAITTPPATRVEILTYTASAKRTEKSSNLSVFNGDRGLSSVFASSNYRTANGCLLSESLFGNVLISNSDLPRDKNYLLTGVSISISGALEPSGNMTTHSPIDLSAPTSDGKAFKALYCQFSSDQQANLNIIANELIYSSTGGNWGDDAKVKIVADGTFTDLNGNKCKAVIHKLAKPYGFIKL
ncbi:hypothetical protein KW452_02275 [Vibrio fluvialis]|nr:hypothetical protein [Vibrio fluvialis]